jgi:hypothetical protein
MTGQAGIAGARSEEEVDPRCAEAQADGMPCAGVEPACEDCEHSGRKAPTPGRGERNGG